MNRKKLKQLIAVTVIATTVATTMPIGINSNVAFASDITYTTEADATAAGFTVELVNNNAEYMITGYSAPIGASTDITIPTKINGKNVTIIGNSAFKGSSSLTSINIPSSVGNIGLYAFQNCSSLTSINLPSSIKSIGNDAFDSCSSLTSINIPNGITSIGSSVFQNCSKLVSINLPSSVTSIGTTAFYGCSALTSINIPSSVTSIGMYAFSGCSGLTSINIPSSVTSIANNTFYNCKGLTSIDIPSSVTSIGSSAFYGCSGLTSINIPNGVTSISNGAFYGCSGLTSINIPSGVTSIGGSAFQNCSGLTSINLPNSVTSIGGSAFRNCSSLTSINIPSSVISIGDIAFYNCSGLTSINIPSSVTKIGDWALYGCSGLTLINIPNSVTSIGYAAFYSCSSLTSITIPSSVTSIGDYAFGASSSLTSINIPSSVTSIGNYAFDSIDTRAIFYVQNDAVKNLLVARGYPTSNTNQRIANILETIITSVTDIADNGNGQDLQVQFNKAADENLVESYRIMAVKAKSAATFNLAAANALASANYTIVAKTGGNITQILGVGAKDTDGDVITNGQAYKIFVLSVADGINSTANVLSSASAEITLQRPASAAPLTSDITVTNNTGTSDTVVLSNVPAGALVKVYDAVTGGSEIGRDTADASGTATINGALTATGGSVYVTVTESGKGESTPRTEKAYGVEPLAASTAPLADNITVTNNTGSSDTVVLGNVPTGATVKVYDAATGGNEIGAATAGANGTATIIGTLSATGGSVYVTVTEGGKTESGRTSKTYGAEALPVSTAPLADNITVTNNTGSSDTVVLGNVPTGATVKVYDAATGGNEIGAATADANRTATIIGTLSETGGSVYVTVTERGKTESARTSKTYGAEALPVSTAPVENDITVINNTGSSDTVVLGNIPAGATVKVYDAATGGNEIGTATADVNGTATISGTLSATGGSVYVTVTESGKTESARTSKTYGAEALPASTAPSQSDITVTNNTGSSDKIELANVPAGALVKAYDAATEGNEIGRATADSDNTATINGDLAAAGGSVYVTVTESGKTESAPRTEKAYGAEESEPPAPTEVILAEGSLGIAGDSKITNLTSGIKYKVRINDITKYVKSNGILSSLESDVEPLEGSEITGLTNGVTYNVLEYSTTQAAVTYTLNYSAEEGGKIIGDSSQTVNSGDDGSEVTAVADENYHFVKWSDGEKDARRKDININSDIDVSAIFEKDSSLPEDPGVPDAEGIPTKINIKGTAEVGNTLSAEFIDEDGISVTTSSAVTYKWYRSDNNSETGNLTGENAVYQLTKSDAGKYIYLIALFDDKELRSSTLKIKDKVTASTSSSKSHKASNTEQIKASVTNGSDNNSVSQIDIERTKLSDGTKKDNIEFTKSKAEQAVTTLKEEGKDVERIVLPDEKDEVSEQNINIPIATISVLSKGNIQLEIDTENARISLPKESVQYLSQNETIQGNKDLYFRIVPIKDGKTQGEIETRANQEKVVQEVSGNSSVQVLGRPMEIETNISQKAVDIILPLKNVNIPSDQSAREAFLKDLGIFIEHSDGEKAFVEGEIVEYEPGVLGLKFTTNKFSTFTIVKLNKKVTTGTWENGLQGWKYIKDGKPATGWNLIDGHWYLMDSAGIMQTGWRQTDGTWYLLNGDGAMTTGWQQINGYWYLLNSNGKMMTGWQQANEKWYYLYEDGSMASNTEISGYSLDENGVWLG